MINRLKKLFARSPEEEASLAGKHDLEDKHIAAAALLVEAACLDDHFEAAERQTIERLARDRFSLSAEETETLVSLAAAHQDDANHLFRFTHQIKQSYAPEERVELMEMLWEVVYADGELHDFEANLLRRIGGLLYVSDRESGDARTRVWERRGIG